VLGLQQKRAQLSINVGKEAKDKDGDLSENHNEPWYTHVEKGMQMIDDGVTGGA
jgi:hypothetical protein